VKSENSLGETSHSYFCISRLCLSMEFFRDYVEVLGDSIGVLGNL
jgi:hypothetical protein